MTDYAVRYEYVRSSAAQRDLHRPEHVEFLRGLYESGRIAASGRLEDSARPGALIVVRAADANDAEKLLEGDPFWTAGVIAERDIREWNVAFGSVGTTGVAR